MLAWLYKWLPIVFGCHCRADRSFHYKGTQFPICARCTGELVGILLGLLSFAFLRPALSVAVLLLIPMLLDGFAQALTRHESNNNLRLFTGILFGYGLVCLFLITTGWAFQYGLALGQQWKTI